jgi:hypothetical protein
MLLHWCSVSCSTVVSFFVPLPHSADMPQYYTIQSSVCHLLSRWYLARIILRSWRWIRYVPSKRRLTFNGLHSVIPQKIVVFITTAMRTSNPTYCLYLVPGSPGVTLEDHGSNPRFNHNWLNWLHGWRFKALKWVLILLWNNKSESALLNRVDKPQENQSSRNSRARRTQ